MPAMSPLTSWPCNMHAPAMLGWEWVQHVCLYSCALCPKSHCLQAFREDGFQWITLVALCTTISFSFNAGLKWITTTNHLIKVDFKGLPWRNSRRPLHKTAMLPAGLGHWFPTDWLTLSWVEVWTFLTLRLFDLWLPPLHTDLQNNFLSKKPNFVHGV